MATLIGVVSQVIGEVYAVAGDGTRRPLSEGDRVFAGEQIVTGAAGSIAVAMSNGQQLTLGRDSSLNLNEQMLADNSNSQVPTAETPPAAPSDGDLTDVEQLQAAIEAGVDPTLEGEATAAGPGAGGAGGAGGVGGGHSFVLLGETGGALDPIIGFPTEGLNTGPEFPNPEPEVADEAPDSSPTIEIIYFDQEGSVITGPGVVEEAALNPDAVNNLDGQAGSNPGSNAENVSGSLIINSPDGISAIQVLDKDGVWINVQGGGVVQGVYGQLVFDAAGNWTYTLADNTLNHSIPGAVGACIPKKDHTPVLISCRIKIFISNYLNCSIATVVPCFGIINSLVITPFIFLFVAGCTIHKNHVVVKGIFESAIPDWVLLLRRWKSCQGPTVVFHFEDHSIICGGGCIFYQWLYP